MKSLSTRPFYGHPLAVYAIVITLFISCSHYGDSLKSIRNNWSSYIYHGSTEYTYSKLGGVDAFDIPIHNNTSYVLDEVKVKVSYIKAAGGVFKNEYVTITNVPPNAVKTVRAPRSKRGTSIDLEITEAYSRGLQFCYPRGGGDYSDPYYCK